MYSSFTSPNQIFLKWQVLSDQFVVRIPWYWRWRYHCISKCTIFFLLAIVLSVLLRYTDSDYPFGIFKLFLDGRWQNVCCLLSNEWLLCNAISAIFRLYHGENKLIFNEMMIRSTLYWTNTVCWIFIVLAHWNNSPRIDMLHHRTYYRDSEPISLCSFSLVLRA